MTHSTPSTLDGALSEHGSLTRLARRLGISPSYLCDIRKGRTVPPLKLAVQIHKATGVPVESFVEAPHPEAA